MSRDDVVLGSFDTAGMSNPYDDDAFEDGIRMTDRLVETPKAYTTESGFTSNGAGQPSGQQQGNGSGGFIKQTGLYIKPSDESVAAFNAQTPPVTETEYWTQFHFVVPCFFCMLFAFVLFVTIMGFQTLHPFWGLQVVCAMLPGFILMYLIYWRNDKSRAQLRFVLVCFLAGMICAIPAALVEVLTGLFIPSWLESASDILKFLIVAFQYFVCVALVEELSKYLAVNWISGRPQNDDPIGAVIYAISAALGFATLENILYVVNAPLTETVMVAIFRALMAVPSHAIEGCIIGVGISRRDFFKEETNVFKILAIPVLLHGSYDFLLSLPTSTNGKLLGFLGAVIVLVIGYRYAKKLYRQLREDCMDSPV